MVDSLNLSTPAIFDSIEAQGNAKINQDQRIVQLIALKKAGYNAPQVDDKPIEGFRVQIFSSNSQRTARSSAFQLQARVRESGIDTQTHIVYNPPFWKVRLGDFRTKAEAQLLRKQVIKLMPDLQDDTYIVRDNIEIEQQAGQINQE